MASALFRLSSNGGTTYAAAGVSLAGTLALTNGSSYSIRAALDSAAGVRSVAWSFVGIDDANLTTPPTLTTNPDKSCSFTAAAGGGAWLLRCQVNGGINLATGAPDPTLTATLKIVVKASNGSEVVALGETSEAGPAGWLKPVNDAIRAAGGGGGGAVTLSGNVTGPNSATVVAVVPSAVVATSLGGLASNPGLNSHKFTGVIDATADTEFASYGQVKAAAGVGEAAVSLGTGGTTALTSTELQAAAVRFTGTLTTDALATFAISSLPGRSWVARAEGTGNALQQARAVTGSRLVTFLPGQVRRLTAVNGELRCEDEKILCLEVDVSLVRGSVGNDDTVLCKLPAGVVLRYALVRGVTAVVGGTSTVSIGTAAGGAQILAATAAPAAGAVLGESGQLGTDMTSGSAVYSAATTVYLRNAVTTAATTAGVVRVTLLAVLV